MKITVWGGSGFLGSHVCDALTNNGHDVTIADIKVSKYLKKNQTMFVGDILSKQDVKKSLDGSEIVFNFAGIADINEANNDPELSANNNIIGCINLLNCCNKLEGFKKFILASTLYVNSKSGGFYRCSKQSAESYVKEFHKQNNLPFLILRFGSLYGTRSGNNNGIYKFLSDAIANNAINYSGNEESRREYIYAEDAADICVDLIKSGITNEIYTLSGTSSISMKDLFALISEILGKEIKYKYLQSDDNESFHYHITPYNYEEETSKKYTMPVHTDLGEGLLKVISEIKKN
tara:strand:+ start:507 stop:1379 length:873 start_codon:yes stop_codon:yes gene_type:complete